MCVCKCVFVFFNFGCHPKLYGVQLFKSFCVCSIVVVTCVCVCVYKCLCVYHVYVCICVCITVCGERVQLQADICKLIW